jgi:hypothetical protein
VRWIDAPQLLLVPRLGQDLQLVLEPLPVLGPLLQILVRYARVKRRLLHECE